MLRVIPSFIAGYFTLEDAYSIYYMSDCLAILLLSTYAYKTIPWKKPHIKVVSMVLVVVSALFVVSYALVESKVDNIELIGG